MLRRFNTLYKKMEKTETHIDSVPHNYDTGYKVVQEDYDYINPDPPWDSSKFDYSYYLPGESIHQIKSDWTSDPAFLPTTLVHGLTFIVGVTGNVIVVFALLGDKKSRSATSSFLVSLAIADLLFLLVCVPYETVSKVYAGYWTSGLALCKISGFVEMLSAAASILNLTAVSLER